MLGLASAISRNGQLQGSSQRFQADSGASASQESTRSSPGTLIRSALHAMNEHSNSGLCPISDHANACHCVMTSKTLNVGLSQCVGSMLGSEVLMWQVDCHKPQLRQASPALMLGFLCRSASFMGEYRGIMNLCRVLPNGTDAKFLVDDAIDQGASIGNLRNDIVR